MATQSTIGDRALTAARDEAGVFRQYARGVPRRRGVPLLFPRRELAVRDIDPQLSLAGIDRDGIAFADQRECAPDRRFRRDVAHHEAVRAAGEPAIGYESDAVAQSRADQGGSRSQHLPHARSAFRTFITDDDDVTLLDRARENRCQTR